MTVRDMLELCNDASNIHIIIYDCESEKNIFDFAELPDYEDPVSEIIFSNIADYEVESYDLYLGDGEINLEINISCESGDDE